jgi:BirA family biotin operon repressor/biotin-[acetyl-CoA-carboxylase] ligase
LSRALVSWLGRWRGEGFAVIRDAWRERGPAPGAVVSVGLTEGSVTGEFAGLDDDGALLLDTRAGRRRIIAGDVLFGTG